MVPEKAKRPNLGLENVPSGLLIKCSSCRSPTWASGTEFAWCILLWGYNEKCLMVTNGNLLQGWTEPSLVVAECSIMIFWMEDLVHSKNSLGSS